jgi:DDE superfamily endonuclease
LTAGVKEAIEAAGATVQYLPQYSPDFNPIEMPFSKFKAFLAIHPTAMLATAIRLMAMAATTSRAIALPAGSRSIAPDGTDFCFQANAFERLSWCGQPANRHRITQLSSAKLRT